MFNYRADRAREITLALTDPTLEKPSRASLPTNLTYTMMTQYDKTLPLPYVLPPEHPDNILADVMGQASWKNLRVAETEKYAHVTYFFNGGNEKPYPGEEREMVASPKVATYDLKPEMSAQGITDKVVKAIEQGSFDVIVMNYANADMVGHSGKMEPTVRACEAVDARLVTDLQHLEALRRIMAHYGGPWQCRNHDRPRDQGAAHIPHDQPRSVHLHDERQSGTGPRRCTERHRTHFVRHLRSG